MTTPTDHPQLTGGAWRLDPQRSRAEFHVRSLWGLATVHGHFRQIQGAISADGRIELTINAGSLHTGNPMRDRHLRSADFFSVDEHPHVHFRSSSAVRRADETWRIDGELEAAGQRLELELTPTIRSVPDGLEIDVETSIDQHRLGMTLTRFGIRRPATVVVHALLLPDAVDG